MLPLSRIRSRPCSSVIRPPQAGGASRGDTAALAWAKSLPCVRKGRGACQPQGRSGRPRPPMRSRGSCAPCPGNTRPPAVAWRYRTVDDGAQQRRTAHNLDPIVGRRKQALLTAGSAGARVLPEVPIMGANICTEEAAPASAGTASDLRSSQSGRRDLNPRPLDPQSSALPNCATSRCSFGSGLSPRRSRTKNNTALQGVLAHPPPRSSRPGRRNRRGPRVRS